MAGWIGVDLDGTLAHFDRWRGPRHIGLPIASMVRRVAEWRSQGIEVRIFTARASRPELIPDVKAWLRKHNLPDLAVTNQKDFDMIELWDDRAVQVLYNTGKAVRPDINRDRGRPALIDPDAEPEATETADDTLGQTLLEPSPEAVEQFKRQAAVSAPHTLDELLEALDEGDYRPGEHGPDETAADTVGELDHDLSGDAAAPGHDTDDTIVLDALDQTQPTPAFRSEPTPPPDKHAAHSASPPAALGDRAANPSVSADSRPPLQQRQFRREDSAADRTAANTLDFAAAGPIIVYHGHGHEITDADVAGAELPSRGYPTLEIEDDDEPFFDELPALRVERR